MGIENEKKTKYNHGLVGKVMTPIVDGFCVSKRTLADHKPNAGIHNRTINSRPNSRLKTMPKGNPKTRKSNDTNRTIEESSS